MTADELLDQFYLDAAKSPFPKIAVSAKEFGPKMSNLDGKTIPEAIELLKAKFSVEDEKEQARRASLNEHVERMTETLIQTYHKGRREGYLLAFEIVLREAEMSGNLTTLVKRIESYIEMQRQLLLMSE